MKNVGREQALWLVGLVALVAAMGTVAPSAYAQATIADLVRVSRAKGDEYKALRDDLLKRHPKKWDVAAATALSWESGVAALALNTHLEGAAEIQRWKNQAKPGIRPVHGKSRAFRGADPRILRAWQIEAIWKYGADFGRDLSFSKKSPLDDVPTELWKGMWENAENMTLRKIAIHALACGDDPAAYDTLATALNDPDHGGGSWHACLVGLGYRQADDATDLLLGAWESIEKRIGSLHTAVAVLGAQGDARAREHLQMVANNPKYPDSLRAKAVAGGGSNPQPEGGEQFAQFLASDAPVKIKMGALRRAHGWPLANIRPAVRYVLQNETDYHFINESIATLVQCCFRSGAEATVTKEAEEDVRLIEAVAAREDAPEWFTKVCPRYVEILRGYRGPLVGDKFPWERLPNRGK